MGSSERSRLIYLAPTIAELDDVKSRRPRVISRKSARLNKIADNDSQKYPTEAGSHLTASNALQPSSVRQKDASAATSDENNATHSSVKEHTSKATRTPLKAISHGMIPKDATHPMLEKASASVANGSTMKRKKSDESYSREYHQDENSIEVDHSTDKTRQSPIPAVSKADYLRLGRARAVGLQRQNKRKSIVFPAPLRVTPFKAQRAQDQRPGPRPLTMTRANHSFGEGSIGGATTIESIPPPPTHLFSLASITSIFSLLSSPNNFLSSHQGGSQHETSLKFNILALVVRVEGLESCPDWRAGGGKMMDRCEIIVKDASDCAIKIVLEGNCATRWANAKTSQSFAADQDSAGYSHEMNPFDASISAAANDTSTFANGSEMEIQRLSKLFPLRPGDVIVLSRLVLTRPQKKKALPRGEKAIGPASVFATASPRWEPQIELCWRNDVRCEADQRRNFDQSLTAFDARCKAIYRLAIKWNA